MWTYLRKDRFSPDLTASTVKKEQPDPSADLKCDLCHISLSRDSAANNGSGIDIKEHYIRNCPAVPGRALNRQLSRKEIFERIASLSLVKRLSERSENSNNANERVFVFGSRAEGRCSSSRDGFQRSLGEPPD